MKYQKKDLLEFPNQILYALQHYIPHGVELKDIDHIVLAGLGGSGIAGSIALGWFQNTCPIPIVLVQDYTLPAFTNERTLVVLNSYSGATEETLGMARDAVQRNSLIIGISCGGALKELVAQKSVAFYEPMSGFQPRMALGYSLTYLLLIFNELLHLDLLDELKQLPEQLPKEESLLNWAQNIWKELPDPMVPVWVIHADGHSRGLAIRFAQQLQENAKTQANVLVLPESNHNALEAFVEPDGQLHLFIPSDPNPRLGLRFKYLMEHFKSLGISYAILPVQLDKLDQLFQWIYKLDALSLWAADAKNAQSHLIPNILGLKKALSK